MKVHSISDLFLGARSAQSDMLESTLLAFTASPWLRRAYVRGSIASGEYDRVSDIDFVAVYSPRHFNKIVELSPDIMASHFHVLLPPWLDSIVPDFGGVGFVYLVEYNGKVVTIDLYFLPESKIAIITKLTDVKLLYCNSDNDLKQCKGTTQRSTEAGTPRRYGYTPDSERDVTTSLVVEIFVLAIFLMKRIARGQIFLNYSETHRQTCALNRLWRAVYDVPHVDFGFYHLEKALFSSVGGRRFSQPLLRTIQSPLSDQRVVLDKVGLAMEIIQDGSPEVFNRMRKPLEFLLDYLSSWVPTQG